MTRADSARTAEMPQRRDTVADEVTNCAVFIIEALLAAGIQTRVPPEDICELIEPHIAATVAEVLARIGENPTI